MVSKSNEEFLLQQKKRLENLYFNLENYINNNNNNNEENIIIVNLIFFLNLTNFYQIHF
jgi:hypothetical protein